MFSIAATLPRVAATPRAGSRAAARPARVAVAARASVGSDGAVVFTSADFDAGVSTVAVAEREEAVEEVSEEVAEASTPEPVPEPAAEPVASTASPAPAAAKPPTPDPEDSLLSSVLAAFANRRAIETINGRVAMLGFVNAISAEQATHATLFEQFPAALGSVALITLASLAPKLRKNPQAPLDGITEDAEAFFVFKSDAERLNGRAAMVGITAWALIEAVTGTAAL
jgi:hypothetical protein